MTKMRNIPSSRDAIFGRFQAPGYRDAKTYRVRGTPFSDVFKRRIIAMRKYTELGSRRLYRNALVRDRASRALLELLDCLDDQANVIVETEPVIRIADEPGR